MKLHVFTILAVTSLLSSLISCKKKAHTEEATAADSIAMMQKLTDPDLIKLDSILHPVRKGISEISGEMVKLSVWKQDSIWAENDVQWGERFSEVTTFLDNVSAKDRIWNDSLYYFQIDSLLNTAGLALGSSEGQLYAAGALGLRLDLIDSGISDAARDWLKLSAREAVTQMSNDAAIIAPLDTLAAWARSYESFQKRHGTSSLIPRAEELRVDLVSTLIGGMDNTPPFIGDTEIDPSFLALWKGFATKDRKSKCGSLITQWYELLASENFKWTPACSDWITSHNLFMGGVTILTEAPQDTAIAVTDTMIDTAAAQ